MTHAQVLNGSIYQTALYPPYAGGGCHLATGMHIQVNDEFELL